MTTRNTTTITTNKRRYSRVGSVGIALLKFVAVTGIVVTIVVLPGMANCIAPFLKEKKYSRKQAVERNIRSLVKNGFLLERKNSRGETVLEITKRGKWESIIRRDHENQRAKSWNSIWHVVIFDIPSTKERRVRGELHRALTLYGFRMLQKSIWVYPHDCEDFLNALKSYLGVSRDILYMKTNYIENDTRLRREFGI